MALSSGETDPVLRNLMDIMYNNNNTNDEHMVPNGLKRPESSSLSSVPVPLPLPPQLMSTSTSKAPPRAPPMTTLTARRPPSRVGKQTSSFHTLMKQEEIRHQRKILEIRRAHEGPKERTERNMLAISQLPEFQKHAIPMRNYMFNKILVGYANNKQVSLYFLTPCPDSFPPLPVCDRLRSNTDNKRITDRRPYHRPRLLGRTPRSNPSRRTEPPPLPLRPPRLSCRRQTTRVGLPTQPSKGGGQEVVAGS